MAAALDCFTVKGFSETSMADIQERSSASMGSIYHHFESKERLAAALYLEGLRGVHGAIRGVLAGTEQAEEGIKALVQAYIDWFVQHPDLGHYLFQGMGAQYLEVEGEKIREPDLIVPHEQLTARAFMLRPLLDVAGDACDAESGLVFAELPLASAQLTRVRQ